MIVWTELRQETLRVLPGGNECASFDAKIHSTHVALTLSRQTALAGIFIHFCYDHGHFPLLPNSPKIRVVVVSTHRPCWIGCCPCHHQRFTGKPPSFCCPSPPFSSRKQERAFGVPISRIFEFSGSCCHPASSNNFIVFFLICSCLLRSCMGMHRQSGAPNLIVLD